MASKLESPKKMKITAAPQADNIDEAAKNAAAVVTETADLTTKTTTTMRLAEAHKRELTSFFAKYGMNFTQGLLISAEYVRALTESKEITLSPAGIVDRQ